MWLMAEDSEPPATKRKPPAVAMRSTLAATLGTKTWGVMVGCDSVPPNDPKLSDSRPTATATDTARSGTAARVRNG